MSRELGTTIIKVRAILKIILQNKIKIIYNE